MTDKKTLERLFLIDWLIAFGKINKIATFDIGNPANLLISTHACNHAEISSICSKFYESFGDFTQVIHQYRTTTGFRGYARFITNLHMKQTFDSDEKFDLIAMEPSSSIETINLMLSKLNDAGFMIISSDNEGGELRNIVNQHSPLHSLIHLDHGNYLICPSTLTAEISKKVDMGIAIPLLQGKLKRLNSPLTPVKHGFFLRLIKNVFKRFGRGVYRLANNQGPPVFD